MTGPIPRCNARVELTVTEFLRLDRMPSAKHAVPARLHCELEQAATRGARPVIAGQRADVRPPARVPPGRCGENPMGFSHETILRRISAGYDQTRAP